MTKEMVFESIKAVAEAYGFEAKVERSYGYELKINDPEGAVNVWVLPEKRTYSEDYTEVTTVLEIGAGVKSCGGDPGADQLFKTGVRIAQAATMVKAFETMNLTYTEKTGYERFSK